MLAKVFFIAWICANIQILAAGISQSDWSFNNRAVNGSKLLQGSLTISMQPSSPRNKSAEVNVSLYDILVVLGELSSFLSLLKMTFGLTQAVSHLEQRSTATVKYDPLGTNLSQDVMPYMDECIVYNNNCV